MPPPRKPVKASQPTARKSETSTQVAKVRSPIAVGLYVIIGVAALIALAVFLNTREFEPKHGWLGVEVQEVTDGLAEALSMDQPKGALVAEVLDDSPAEKAGLQAGDVIVRFNGKEIATNSDFPPLVIASRVNEAAKLEVIRKGRIKELTVVIRELPDELVAGAEPEDVAEPMPQSFADKLPASDLAGLLAESREAWLTGRYDVALNLFDEIRRSHIESSARELAYSRYEWLAPYRKRVLFADDFQTDSLSNGTRWTSEPGAPPTGRGGATLVSVDGNSVLQLRDHYHAIPRIDDTGVIHAFEIRMRYRAKAAPEVGAHINLMMDEREGRTTVGLYAAAGELSIWEEKDGREIGHKNVRARHSGWQDLRIVVEKERVYLYLNKDLLIDYRSPRARLISLNNFNLETLSGTVWFDNVLVMTH